MTRPHHHPSDERARLLADFRRILADRHGRDRRPDGTGGDGASPIDSDSLPPSRLSLLAWGRRMLPEYFTRPASKMHEWISSKLERLAQKRGLKLNIAGPRGSAKSTLITLAYVLRCALEMREPYIWILSDTRQQVRSHLDCIRVQLEQSTPLALAYPGSTGRGATWQSHSLQLKNGVMIEAFGSGQRIRGKRSGAHRPMLIVCDDLQNDSHIYSSELRESSLNWFTGTVLKAGTDQTNVIHLGTALHRDCLAMHLTHTPGWRSEVFASIVRWPEQMPLWSQWESIFSSVENPHAIRDAETFYATHRAAMDAGAEVLWPAGEDLYSLMRLRAEGGHLAFEREKQNRPMLPEQCEWSEALFDESIWFDEWPQHFKIKTIALDPSKGSDAKRGDFSAFVLLGIDENGIHYVDADMSRRSTSRIVSDGVELVRQFVPDAFGVESNQFQQLLADAFSEEFRRQNLPSVSPWMIENRTNKMIRIRRLSPLISGKKIRFKSGSSGARILVEQLQTFPIGDHDDGPDALEMSIRLSREFSSSVPRDDHLGNILNF